MGREGKAGELGAKMPGQRWPERLVATEGKKCSRETVAKHCWGVRCCWGLWQMRTEEWLLNLDLEVIESLLRSGLVLSGGQKAHCRVLRGGSKVRTDCSFGEFCCG